MDELDVALAVLHGRHNLAYPRPAEWVSHRIQRLVKSNQSPAAFSVPSTVSGSSRSAAWMCVSLTA